MAATLVFIFDHFNAKGFTETAGGTLEHNAMPCSRRFNDLESACAGKLFDLPEIVRVRPKLGLELFAGRVVAVTGQAMGQSAIFVERWGGRSRVNNNGDLNSFFPATRADHGSASDRHVLAPLDRNVSGLGHRDSSLGQCAAGGYSRTKNHTTFTLVFAQILESGRFVPVEISNWSRSR